MPPPSTNQVPGTAQKTQSSVASSNLIPGQYIVVFKDQANGLINENIARQAVQRTQAIFNDYQMAEDSLLFQYKYALKGFSAKLSLQQADRLSQDPRVERISQARMFQLGTSGLISLTDLSVKSSVATTFAGQFVPYGVARVNGPLDGTGKTAWIIDSGIDLDHPDLNVDVDNSVSFVANESADDLNGHGTHVAGIVAAKDNNQDVVGVAADATVIAVKVCNSSGGCPETGYLNGIDYVSNQAASDDIVNISIWGPTDTDVDNAVLNTANNGVRLTLIAGNVGADASNYSPGRVNYANIWTMSAYDANDNFASFSNFGNPPIEYGGPGVDVPSLWRNGGTNTISGTSMAAPHIAGLLLAAPNDVTTDGVVSNDPDNDPDPIAVYDLPLAVSVSGPKTVNAGQLNTWTANPQHSPGPYSYQWYYTTNATSSWIADGTDSDTYSRSFSQPSSTATSQGVRVVVTNASEQAEGVKYIIVVDDCDPAYEICAGSSSLQTSVN